MPHDVSAEVIAIGTEILLGEITDTNSVFIARHLRDIGVNLYYMTTVGDNESRIADAIRGALRRADIVITCGGLGPTVDDMTRQGVAAATERGLTFYPELLESIAQRFATFRAQMTDNNRRQAYLPDGALALENPVGTAPGFIVEQGERAVISVPGVPREMKFLMTERVVPYLRERYGLSGRIIKARVLRTAGVGESMLDDRIGPELLEMSNPTVGLAAHSGQVDVRITAKAETVEEADRLIASVEARLRERVGDAIFGTDDETIEMALARALESRAGRLAVCEAGLDGAVAERLAAIESAGLLAARRTFAHPEALRDSLGMSAATPLRQLAEQAAERLCADTGAAVGIAVVALPDVTTDQSDASQGSAVAVCALGETRSRAYGFGARSDTARPWTGTWALATAWRALTQQA